MSLHRTAAILLALLLGAPTGPLSAQPTEPAPREATLVHLDRGWQVDGALPTKAFLISLQGVVNQEAPRLYFVYPPDWTYPFTGPVAEYYRDTTELALADRILDSMAPGGLVMGWHSYAKDTEGQHVTLVSQHALAMEGLNTLPNTSFNTQISTTPGFTFENNHSVPPGTTLTPKKKVYLSPIQTDGLGIGAWQEPGRGSIPYAWEVTMNWAWLSPALLQFFCQQATSNDYFIGSLSGPGYLYPKAIPDTSRSALIDEAERLMRRLDLRVFEIMDYSEGKTGSGAMSTCQNPSSTTTITEC